MRVKDENGEQVTPTALFLPGVAGNIKLSPFITRRVPAQSRPACPELVGSLSGIETIGPTR